MDLEFFFSYSRANAGPYLDQFFEDLSQDIREKRGLPNSAVVGFRDQNNIELGMEWEPTVLDALQRCRVMLAVGSPAYFKSAYCGKEWAFFRARADASKGTAASAPPLLKSVVWIPYVIESLPIKVNALQLATGDKEAVRNTRGLQYMLKQIALHKNEYNDFVYALGDEVIRTADRHAAPPLPDAPALNSVAPAFPVDGRNIDISPIVVPSGPKHVHFIYVAAHPNEFGNARSAAPYVDEGAGDWKPFFPHDPRRVNPLLQQVASRDEFAFSSTEVPFGPDFIERIKAAWVQRQIVVIVIDPWSLHWDSLLPAPRYQPLLQELDTRLDYHWCVLVPWNERDDGIARCRDQVASVVRGTFDRHASLLPNPLFYRDDIASAADLQSAVAEALTRLNEEIKKRADVARPMPSGPARPTVTGPGSGS